MSIPLPLAEFICAEHRFRPLPERILLLGRQTMTFGVNELAHLAGKFGLDFDPSSVELDTRTTYAKFRPEMGFVTDTSFFRCSG